MDTITSEEHLLTSAPWARTDEPLLWLVGTGHRTVTRDSGYHFDCRLRTDAHLGLQLTLAGEGYYERGGRTIPLPAGCAFFDVFPGDFRYGYPAGATAPYEHAWINFQGPTARRLWEQARGRFGPVLDLGTGSPLAPLMLTVVREHASGLLSDRYLASARLYEVLMRLLSLQSRTRLATSPLVQRALAAIHRRGLEADWDIGALADDMQVSREHLARAFSTATGLAPKAYLLQHRLQRAQQELRAGGDGLDAIARRCGFNGANYFCRAFRRRYGLTPGAFRSQPWR